ncbi:hypothetical protein [Solibacillus sp. CAU 1738]|uniref:hypothetical protein n=1 Tax=Solibacillus sp. CAU 1738 TaxID=3140363 RepID=UPI00325FE670
MLKKLALILLTVGMFFIAYAGMELKSVNSQKKVALAQAKEDLERQIIETSQPEVANPELSFQNG